MIPPWMRAAGGGTCLVMSLAVGMGSAGAAGIDPGSVESALSLVPSPPAPASSGGGSPVTRPALPPEATASSRLGPLFYTPREREQLGRMRAQAANPPREGVPSGVNTDGQPVVESAAVKAPIVTGYVLRSSGKNTLWLNQRPLARESRQGPDP